VCVCCAYLVRRNLVSCHVQPVAMTPTPGPVPVAAKSEAALFSADDDAGGLFSDLSVRGVSVCCGCCTFRSRPVRILLGCDQLGGSSSAASTDLFGMVRFLVLQCDAAGVCHVEFAHRWTRLRTVPLSPRVERLVTSPVT
jgi:hypothetical protein